MTQRQVWEYVRRRVRDAHEAHDYAVEVVCAENGIDEPQRHLINEETFSYFEIELEARGREMSSKPHNQQFPTKLPGGWILLAAAYGTGKDDYIAIVLGFDGESKLVTWVANFSDGPQAHDEVAYGNGRYFDYRDSENNAAVDEAWKRVITDDSTQDFVTTVNLARRDKTIERAWADFFVRATPLMRFAVEVKK